MPINSGQSGYLNLEVIITYIDCYTIPFHFNFIKFCSIKYSPFIFSSLGVDGVHRGCLGDPCLLFGCKPELYVPRRVTFHLW